MLLKALFNKIFKKKNKKVDNPILLLQESSNILSTFFYNNKESIDKEKANILIEDLNNYTNRLNNVIINFKVSNNLDYALKGKSNEALKKYIDNIVNSLNIYTNSYNNLAKNIENYIKGDNNGK